MIIWSALANLDLLTELMLRRDLRYSIIIEMQTLTIEQLRIILNIMKNYELLAAQESHIWNQRMISSQRILLSLITSIQGKLAGIELTDPTGMSSDIIPTSRYGENDKRYKQNRDSILKLYDELLKQLNN